MYAYNIRDFTLDPLRGKNVFPVFERAMSALGKMDIPYWVSAGTMLGLYRDGDFIPDDTDMDMEVYITGDKGLEYFYQPPFDNSVRRSYWRGNLCQAAYIDGENIVVDVYIYRKYGDTICSWSESSGVISYPVSFLDKIEKFEYQGNEYPCIEPEMYLEYLYGSDWRIPEKEGKPLWVK